MQKSSLIIGIITGIIVVGKMLLEYVFGFHSEHLEMGIYLGYLRYPLLLLGIILAIYFYAKGQVENGVSYMKLLQQGIFVGLIIAVITALGHAIYHGVINTHFGVDYKAYLYQLLDSKDLSEQHKQLKKIEIDNQIADSKWIITPLGSASFYFLETMLITFFFAALTAIFFTKKITKSESKK